MTASQTRRTPVLRNTCTVVALLGFGLVAGAFLGETSLKDFSLSFPSSLSPRSSGLAGNVNGYLTPSISRGQTRRPLSQPHGISGHHTGL